jgi:hypothetical protein
MGTRRKRERQQDLWIATSLKRRASRTRRGNSWHAWIGSGKRRDPIGNGRAPAILMNSLDRFFWMTLRQCWSRWTDLLLLVKPDTVIAWHRAGFRLYGR